VYTQRIRSGLLQKIRRIRTLLSPDEEIDCGQIAVLAAEELRTSFEQRQLVVIQPIVKSGRLRHDLAEVPSPLMLAGGQEKYGAVDLRWWCRIAQVNDSWLSSGLIQERTGLIGAVEKLTRKGLI